MGHMDNLELLPEPEEPRMLTTIDSDAPGYPGEAYGISDEEARELRWPASPLRAVSYTHLTLPTILLV